MFQRRESATVEFRVESKIHALTGGPKTGVVSAAISDLREVHDIEESVEKEQEFRNNTPNPASANSRGVKIFLSGLVRGGQIFSVSLFDLGEELMQAHGRTLLLIDEHEKDYYKLLTQVPLKKTCASLARSTCWEETYRPWEIARKIDIRVAGTQERRGGGGPPGGTAARGTEEDKSDLKSVKHKLKEAKKSLHPLDTFMAEGLVGALFGGSNAGLAEGLDTATLASIGLLGSKKCPAEKSTSTMKALGLGNGKETDFSTEKNSSAVLMSGDLATVPTVLNLPSAGDAFQYARVVCTSTATLVALREQ